MSHRYFTGCGPLDHRLNSLTHHVEPRVFRGVPIWQVRVIHGGSASGGGWCPLLRSDGILQLQVYIGIVSNLLNLNMGWSQSFRNPKELSSKSTQLWPTTISELNHLFLWSIYIMANSLFIGGIQYASLQFSMSSSVFWDATLRSSSWVMVQVVLTVDSCCVATMIPNMLKTCRKA